MFQQLFILYQVLWLLSMGLTWAVLGIISEQIIRKFNSETRIFHRTKAPYVIIFPFDNMTGQMESPTRMGGAFYYYAVYCSQATLSIRLFLIGGAAGIS